MRVVAPHATELAFARGHAQRKSAGKNADFARLVHVRSGESVSRRRRNILACAARARFTERRDGARVLCNVVDDPEHCDFYYGSVVRRGALQIAISTAGHSPALAQRLRKQIEQEFGEEYELWLEELGKARKNFSARQFRRNAAARCCIGLQAKLLLKIFCAAGSAFAAAKATFRLKLARNRERGWVPSIIRRTRFRRSLLESAHSPKRSGSGIPPHPNLPSPDRSPKLPGSQPEAFRRFSSSSFLPR